MRLRKEERRAQILDVAKKIFVEKGYHQTKTKDIALACGISEPVIYKHYSGKDELFLAVMAEIAGETFHEINFSRKEDTEYILRSFVLNRIEALENNFHLFKRLLSELLENEEIRQYYFEKFVPRLAYPVIGYIDQLKEENLIKKDVPSIIITLTMVGIFLTIALAKNLDRKTAFSEYSSRELAEEMMHIYLYGLIQKENA